MADTMTAPVRMRERYVDEIRDVLMNELGLSNVMQVPKLTKIVVNVGVGVEYLYAGGFVRSALAMGPSILAFDTALDDAGTTGFFFDLHPVGLRWAPHERVILGLDPVAFSMVAPVLDGIPLVNVAYRTCFYVEVVF